MAKFKQVILAVAIAVVLAFFVGFGIATFYPEPRYQDFCDAEKVRAIHTQEECEEQGGKWNPDNVAIPTKLERNQLLCTKTAEQDDSVTLDCKEAEQVNNPGYCNQEFDCRKAYDQASEPYNRNVFIIAVGLGIIAIIIGFALKVPGVSSGIMSGGILLVIYGVIRYWSNLAEYGRFIILGIALAILIWLGYKKTKK